MENLVRYKSIILSSARLFSLKVLRKIINKYNIMGRDISLLCPKDFNPEMYLTIYPQLKNCGMSPSFHYLMHGRFEGRVYRMEDLLKIDHHNDSLENILLVSHDGLLGGAPILSFNILKKLEKKYNVIFMFLGGGPLVDIIRELGGSVLLVDGIKNNPLFLADLIKKLNNRFAFKYAIVNSIESRHVLPHLGNLYIPSVSLIHEYASYWRPKSAFPEAFFWSGAVVFSAENVLQNTYLAFPYLRECLTYIYPQGSCELPLIACNEKHHEEGLNELMLAIRPLDSAKKLIVMGAGYVQIRKGVDLFLDCAMKVLNTPDGANYRFVWIGKSNPEEDLGYFDYLQEQVRIAGLEGRVAFVRESFYLNDAYSDIDIFLLTSRSDPLPNVAIDAMKNGVPIICFEKTGGIPDCLVEYGLGEWCVAPYLDVDSMAQKVTRIGGSVELKERLSSTVKNISKKYFDMDLYVDKLEALTQRVAEACEDEKEDVKTILNSGSYLEEYSSTANLAGLDLEAKVRLFVRSWASMVGRRKPMPGFHPGIYSELNELSPTDENPFAHFLRNEKPNGPWNNDVIYPQKTRSYKLPENAEVALQIHVYYPELLVDIIKRLSDNKIRPDLFISTSSEIKRQEINKISQLYNGNVICVEIFENLGRDIGPFISQFKEKIINKYKYVGHIHTKKTLDIKDRSVIEDWYDFLLGNLLGGVNCNHMADSILHVMNQNSTLGLVFPDDPNIISWDLNYDIGNNLAKKICINNLPKNIIFPVGTMFWAKSKALLPIINFSIDLVEYPKEPLPYDGTILHAIERLIPTVVCSSGFSIATTYVPGLTR